MTTGLSAWPPELDDEAKRKLCLQATDYAISHSILYRPVAPSGSLQPPLDAAIHAPISLFPTPFPRSLYEQAQRLQPLYNDLYSQIATDNAFLERVIGGNVILVDDFQKRIWQIYKHVKAEGIAQVSTTKNVHESSSDSILAASPFGSVQIRLSTSSGVFIICT